MRYPSEGLLFRSFLYDLKSILPLEVALTFGIIIFALSWLWPRRVISLPGAGLRRTVLIWSGTVGALLVVAAATLGSLINVLVYDSSGFDGWWRRPLPLVVVVVVVAIAGVLLRHVPRPRPGEQAIMPQRSWRTFTPQVVLRCVSIGSAVLTVTVVWHIMIAVSASRGGPFFGEVPEYSILPIYMRFNENFGYVAGAGWPNHLATLLLLVLAVVVFVMVLRTDANRPSFADTSLSTVKAPREATARVLSWLLLAGILTTLGAVWMHVGSAGTSLVGLDERWVSETVSYPRLFVDGNYSAIAEPMNLIGYALQGLGVALGLRIATDTVRAAFLPRRAASQGSLGAVR